MIDKKEFMEMKLKEQLGVLFDNQQTTIILIRSYKFNQKIAFAWLAILTIAFGFGKFIGVI